MLIIILVKKNILKRIKIFSFWIRTLLFVELFQFYLLYERFVQQHEQVSLIVIYLSTNKTEWLFIWSLIWQLWVVLCDFFSNEVYVELRNLKMAWWMKTKCLCHTFLMNYYTYTLHIWSVYCQWSDVTCDWWSVRYKGPVSRYFE